MCVDECKAKSTLCFAEAPLLKVYVDALLSMPAGVIKPPPPHDTVRCGTNYTVTFDTFNKLAEQNGKDTACTSTIWGVFVFFYKQSRAILEDLIFGHETLTQKNSLK